MANQSQIYGASPAIRDHHTVLLPPDGRHRWTRPTSTQPDRPILDLPTRERWKAELTLVLAMACTLMVYLSGPQTHPVANQYNSDPVGSWSTTSRA